MAGAVDSLYFDIGTRGEARALSTFALLGQRFGQLQKTASMGLLWGVGGTGLALGGGLAVTGFTKAAMTLETARVNLERVFEGSASSFKQVNEELEKMGRTIPVTIEKIYGIASALSQVGVRGSDLPKVSKEVGMLAAISNLDVETVSKSIAQIMNLYKIPVEKIPGMSASITSISKASAADPGDIISLTKRLSGAASMIGLTVDQTIAFSGAIKDAGINLEVAGTTFSNFMNEMSKAPENFALILEMNDKAFIELRDKNPMTAIMMTLRKLGSMDKQSAVKAMQLLQLGGGRESGAVGQLVAIPDLFQKHLDLAKKSFDEAKETLDQFEKSSRTAEASLTRLGNTFRLMAKEFGGEKFVKGFADFAQWQVEGLVQWKKWLEDPKFRQKLLEEGKDPFGFPAPNKDVINKAKEQSKAVADAWKAEEQNIQAALDRNDIMRAARGENLGGPGLTQQIETAKGMVDAGISAAMKFWEGFEVTSKSEAAVMADKIRAAIADIADRTKGRAMAPNEATAMRQWEALLQEEIKKPQVKNAIIRGRDVLNNSVVGALFGGAGVIGQAANLIGGNAAKQNLEHRFGPMQNVAGEFASRMMALQQRNQSVTFGDALTRHKAYQSGALTDEGDILKQILKENRDHKKLTDEGLTKVEEAVKKGLAELKDGVLIWVD